MRICFLDCSSGAAGNMLLASLLDAGADLGLVERRLRRMPVKGWKLRLRRVRRGGLAALHLEVEQRAQPERSLTDVLDIIDRAKLPPGAAGRSRAVFTALARAEARVHGTSVSRVHFHEVGAVDAMVDIVGTCLALEFLGIEKLHCSPLNLGRGRVRCEHGWLPVPAPATALLLRKARVYQDGLEGELVTPTGAAIISALSSGFGPMPEMCVQSVGHGAGTREMPAPNILRAFVGEGRRTGGVQPGPILLETNLDDTNPQVYEHLMERLFDMGALDSWLTPVIMKKSRPGIVLSALVPPEGEVAAVELILAETTSLGVRRRPVERHVLPRKFVKVRTRYGLVGGKTADLPGGGRRFVPEYVECRKAALKRGVPLRVVQEEAIRMFGNTRGK